MKVMYSLILQTIDHLVPVFNEGYKIIYRIIHGVMTIYEKYAL
jgi:hypothetical protein